MARDTQVWLDRSEVLEQSLHVGATFCAVGIPLDRVEGSELAGGAFVTDVAPETAAAELRRACTAI